MPAERAITVRRSRSPVACCYGLRPGHSGQPGSFAQAGQTQQASHCRHIQMRWLVPVHWMHGWLPTSARAGPRGCPLGHTSGASSMS
jgi:hypothetical protein